MCPLAEGQLLAVALGVRDISNTTTINVTTGTWAKGLAFAKVKVGELKVAPIDLIEKLIEQLDSDDFGTREKATEELTRLRSAAETLLRKKLESLASLHQPNYSL